MYLIIEESLFCHYEKAASCGRSNLSIMLRIVSGDLVMTTTVFFTLLKHPGTFTLLYNLRLSQRSKLFNGVGDF